MKKIAKNYEVARATNLQFLTEFYAKIYEMHYTEVYFSPQNEFGVSPDSSTIYFSMKNSSCLTCNVVVLLEILLHRKSPKKSPEKL